MLPVSLCPTPLASIFRVWLMRRDETVGIENPRLRHIRLHEHVNDLPDPNYATLKYFLGHLQRCVSFVFISSRWCHVNSRLVLDVLRTYRISQFSEQNSMTISNLSIVFGPTLFSQGISNGAQNGITLDPTMQNKVRGRLPRLYPVFHIHSPSAIANRPLRRSWSTTPTSS